MHSQQIIAFVLQAIQSCLNNQIQIVELYKKQPLFVNRDCLTKIQLQFEALACDPQINAKSGLVQQLLEQVPLLEKDSLMPKGIQKQSQQIDKVTLMDEFLSKNKKKNMNGTRTSFNRSNLHSVSNSHRNSKISSFSKKKKQVQNQFIPINQEEADVQIGGLRKIKDMEWDQREKERKELQRKKKMFEQKKNHFKNQLSQKDYTFDFEGDAIESKFQQDKINYHSMKMRLSMADKKLRSNIKFKQNQLVSQIKLESKKSTALQGPSMSVELTSIIPVFQSQTTDAAAIFGIQSQKQKCKLKQFKKHYGGKFARLDKSLNTIQMVSQKNDQYQQIFSERRYLKDQQKNINESMVSYRTQLDHSTRRKLALPKIHGKYSTLDRYQHS